jgi:acetylornithine/succinyldiaminopimelate/putrescine aminotransferase
VLHGVLQGLGGKETRGLGLMQAVEFEEARAKAFQAAALDGGVVVNAVDDHTVRFVPPLIVTAAELDRASSVLRGIGA